MTNQLYLMFCCIHKQRTVLQLKKMGSGSDVGRVLNRRQTYNCCSTKVEKNYNRWGFLTIELQLNSYGNCTFLNTWPSTQPIPFVCARASSLLQ